MKNDDKSEKNVCISWELGHGGLGIQQIFVIEWLRFYDVKIPEDCWNSY